MPLGKQNLIAARMRSRIVAREKVKAAQVRLNFFLHDLRRYLGSRGMTRVAMVGVKLEEEGRVAARPVEEKLVEAHGRQLDLRAREPQMRGPGRCSSRRRSRPAWARATLGILEATVGPLWREARGATEARSRGASDGARRASMAAAQLELGQNPGAGRRGTPGALAGRPTVKYACGRGGKPI